LESGYCLSPMTVDEVEILLGKDFVKTFQTEMDLIINPLRKYIAKGYPLALGKEQWEYVVSESIPKGEWCGAGHGIVDVRVGEQGIDVKGVSKKSKSQSTTEASMFQSFKEETKAYFNNKDEESIWNLFVNGWLQKVKGIKEYYIISIVRDIETTDCSLCCFKVINTDLPYRQGLCSFTASSKSMKVTGLADPEFIDTRVFSSKTRLEIKFKSKVWKDPKYCLQIYKF
jgi:hypothetical protein